MLKNCVEYCYSSIEFQPKCSICGDVAIIKHGLCKKPLLQFFDEYLHYKDYIV